MSAADQSFFLTLRTMRGVSEEALLTDTFPPSDRHNIAARILRHGLSVSAFAVLERYVHAKFSELMSEISKSAVPYASLTPELRKFLTADAVSGLANRMFFLDATDALTYAETNIGLIASYNAPVATYTALGFSPRGSNVSDKDIKQAFSACGVGQAWETLSKITQEIGGSRVSLSTDYRNLAKNRHRSAHNPDGNVPTADLQTHIDTAILVGIAVAILAKGIAKAFSTAKTATKLKSEVSNLTRSYRFVDEQSDGAWVEREAAGGRAVKRYATEALAIAGALARARARLTIVRDVRQIPIALV